MQTRCQQTTARRSDNILHICHRFFDGVYNTVHYQQKNAVHPTFRQQLCKYFPHASSGLLLVCHRTLQMTLDFSTHMTEQHKLTEKTTRKYNRTYTVHTVIIFLVFFFWLLGLLLVFLIFCHHATQESLIDVLLSLKQQLGLSQKQHQHVSITGTLFCNHQYVYGCTATKTVLTSSKLIISYRCFYSR